jgi:cytochrome c
MKALTLGRRTALVLLLTLCAGTAISLQAHAATNATQKEAIAMAEKAAAVQKASGSAKLIERVNAKDPEFLVNEMYVVVLKPDGTHLAHPLNPKLVGKSLLDLPDADGKFFRKERVELAATKGQGWVDYKYKNPETGRVMMKSAYVLKAGDVLISVGIYKD